MHFGTFEATDIQGRDYLNPHTDTQLNIKKKRMRLRPMVQRQLDSSLVHEYMKLLARNHSGYSTIHPASPEFTSRHLTQAKLAEQIGTGEEKSKSISSQNFLDASRIPCVIGY
jgi:hypothetical protein